MNFIYLFHYLLNFKASLTMCKILQFKNVSITRANKIIKKKKLTRENTHNLVYLNEFHITTSLMANIHYYSIMQSAFQIHKMELDNK